MVQPNVYRLIIFNSHEKLNNKTIIKNINADKFLAKFNGKRFDFWTETVTDIIICDFVSKRQAIHIIHEIETILTNLEIDLSFNIDLRLIYYNISQGYYGKYVNCTEIHIKNSRYRIKDEDIILLNCKREVMLPNELGEYKDDNPAYQVADLNFAKFLIKYQMSTILAEF